MEPKLKKSALQRRNEMIIIFVVVIGMLTLAIFINEIKPVETQVQEKYDIREYFPTPEGGYDITEYFKPAKEVNNGDPEL